MLGRVGVWFFFFSFMFYYFPPKYSRNTNLYGEGAWLSAPSAPQPSTRTPAPLWGGRAPPGTSADLVVGGGSPQEAEPTFTLLSYSSSVKYQASAPWVTKNPTNEQFTFHMLPSDSKKVAKTAARLFQSGGLEVAGEAAGRGEPEGNQEGKGRIRMGRGGQALGAGLGEAWGWVELAQTDPG